MLAGVQLCTEKTRVGKNSRPSIPISWPTHQPLDGLASPMRQPPGLEWEDAPLKVTDQQIG
jgi:hypothetical protein